MGIVIRKSIYNSIAIYLGIALGAVSTIFLFPNVLTTDQYGLTRLILSLSGIAATFGGLGIKNILLRYFPLFKNPEKSHNGVLFFSGIITLCGSLLAALVFLVGREQFITYYADGDPLFESYYLYLFFFLFITTSYELFATYLKALKHTVFSLFSHDVIQRILIISSIIAFYLKWINFSQFMLFFTLSHAVSVLLVLGYIIYLGELKLNPNFRFLRVRLLKSIANYGIFALLGGASALIVARIDILMLGALRGLSDVSVYSVAYYIGTVIAVPQRSIYQIAVPVISGALKEKNLAEVQSVYARTSSVQLISGVFILLLIWTNLHSVFEILPEAYNSGKWVILIVGIAKLFDMATGINGGIILMSKHYRFDLYTNIFLIILTIGTNWVLIPSYGMLGAAIATAISIFVYNSIKVLYVWIRMGIQPFRIGDIFILLTGFGSALIMTYIPIYQGIIIDLIIRTALASGLFLGSVFILGLSDELRQMIALFKKKF